MKIRFLLLGSLIVSTAAFAQQSNQAARGTDIGVQDMHAPLMETMTRKTVEQTPSWTSKALNDELGITIFEEDFSAGIPNDWTNTSLSNGNERWVYRGPSTTPNTNTGSQGAYAAGTGPIQSTTRTNGFVIMDSDWWDNGGQVNGTGQQSAANHQAALTTPIFDCSTYPNVLLTVESHLRNFQSFFYILVSTDGFSNEDTIWNGADDYGVNEISPDVELLKFDISDFVGSSSTAQIRFLYASNTAAAMPGYYYWQLDDILVSTPPDHDLAIDDKFYNGYGPFLSDYQFNNYYAKIPVQQASADEVVFGAAMANRGSTTQSNAMITAEVSGPVNFTSSSAGTSFPALTFDSANVADLFSATSVGTYDVTFEVSADSTDDFPEDNSIEESFEVTERDWTRDDGALSGGVYWGSGNYAIYTRYDIFDDEDYISGVWLNLYYSNTNTDFQTTPGSVAEVGVYAITGYDENGNAVVDFENPLSDGTNDALTFYTVEDGDQNTMVLVNFPAPVDIPAGVTEVLAGYSVSAGTIRTSVSDRFVGFGNVWVDTQNDGTLEGYTSANNPMIGIRTWDPDLCVNTTIVIDIQADCDETSYTATLSPAVTTTGSSSTYTYAWSTGETDEEIEIDEEGTYSITVTDGNFCTGTQTQEITNADINCNLSVEDLNGQSFGFNVLPNPNNGHFNLVFDANEAQQVDIVVQSLKGEVVYQNYANISSGHQVELNLNGMASGVYLVKVVGESSTNVERVVIQ